MKSYLVNFTCAENSYNHNEWKLLDSNTQNERLKKGENLLNQWFEKYKDKIIYEGGRLSSTTKIINRNGTHESPSKMGSFLVIKAESIEEVAQMFLGHPHYSVFPGDGIEILEQVDEPRK